MADMQKPHVSPAAENKILPLFQGWLLKNLQTSEGRVKSMRGWEKGTH
jgi:hypothetical protein